MHLEPPQQATFVAKKLPKFTAEQREAILEQTDYNVFNFPASMVTVDLLTDSGTGALYQNQMASLFMGDESYARNNWYYAFLDAMRDFTTRGDNPKKRYLQLFEGAPTYEQMKNLFTDENNEVGGFVNGGVHQLTDPNIWLLPQGRVCEQILFSSLKQYCQDIENPIALSNGFFDTTRANSQVQGFETIDLFSKDISADFPVDKVGVENPFRGDIDVSELTRMLEENPGKVAIIVMTLTNNTGSAQPVSMENMKKVREIADKYEVPLWIDGARIADNCAFVKKFEPGFENLSIPEILRQTFALCDGFHISLKKALCHIGGVMCVRHDGPFLRKYPGINHLFKKLQIIQVGNDSYGALSGAAIAQITCSLYQVVREDYLYARLALTEYLAVELAKKNIPVTLPPGGHAVYIDVNKMFPNAKWDDYKGVGLVSELLRLYGIRGCELGYAAWELDNKVGEDGTLPEKLPPNLVRLAIPANVYSEEHMDYVVAAIDQLNNNKSSVPSFTIGRGKNIELRHFVCGYSKKEN
ncbi:hypothetical protein P9112_007674 [Eukaryota sp. TZLM1-RC]